MSARSAVSAERRAVDESERDAPRPVALNVRPAGRSDLVPLNFFFDAVLRRDYFMRRGQLEEIVGGRHHQVYVAEIDSVLVGVAITTRGSRLVNALVHPAYRGLGIGKELVKRSGATEVRAKLDMSSGDPRGFYRSMGFVSTGRRNAKGNIEILCLSNSAEDKTTRRQARQRQRNNGRRRGNGSVAATKNKSRK